MPSICALMMLRIIPVFLMVAATYLVPWLARTYLLTGYSGANFNQTDVNHCERIHQDVLFGCEDLHVYNAPSGPMIFTGCVEKITDQFVLLGKVTFG